MDGSRKLSWRPILAARYGNKDVVELLLKHGANPDLPAPRNASCLTCTGRREGQRRRCTDKLVRGSRALHLAVEVQHVGIVRTLLLAGADPNVSNCEGFTPLMASCHCKGITPLAAPKMNMAKELLEAGADAARTSERGETALWAAAFGGNTDLVGMLLSRAPGTLNHVSRDGDTPLYVASIAGNVDVVAFLLAAGARQPTTYESTVCPLNASAQEGCVEVVRMLLGRGLEAIGGARTIPEAVAKAVHNGRAGILQMLLDAAHEEQRPESWATCRGSNRPLICCAVADSHLTTLSVLLAAGVDAMAPDSKGKRAQDYMCLPHHWILAQLQGQPFVGCWSGPRLFGVTYGPGPWMPLLSVVPGLRAVLTRSSGPRNRELRWACGSSSPSTARCLHVFSAGKAFSVQARTTSKHALLHDAAGATW